MKGAIVSSESMEELLAGAWVEPEVFALCPDYRVLLLAVDGMVPGPSDATSEALLTQAEEKARELLDASPVDELPSVAAWRDAYRAFGAKPQRTRNSLEALIRRAPAGMPRVNRLTDIYNALSILHQLPLGGEDLPSYVGPPRLLRASGDEPFDTAAAGASVVEFPEVGEVIWADAAGVTCRRWNWRQCRRTRLTDETTSALFIMDALAPTSDAELAATADALVEKLMITAPGLRSSRRVIGARQS